MSSNVNARLAAGLHIRGAEVLDRIAAVERGIDAMISTDRLWAIVTSKASEPKTIKFAESIEADLDNIRVMLRKQIKELARRSHDWAVTAIFNAIPQAVIDYLVPIETRFENVALDRPGRLVFEAGKLSIVYEDEAKPFGIPAKKLARKILSDEEKQQVHRDILFPPPPQTEIDRIVRTGSHQLGGGNPRYVNWEQRFDGLSKLINDKKLAFNEIVYGYGQGENIDALQKRLEPLVGGIKAAARRIARTEASRVAEQIQRRTWDGLDDLMVGVQIIAVLDERTRPEHATRNGQIYYKRPGLGQKSLGELPDLPDAPNCRCISSPVLEAPEEFVKDPLVRREFKDSRGRLSGEPTVYEEWFQSASVQKRKLVTGAARYHEVESRLAGVREPRWNDFIDERGGLLSLDALQNESVTMRTARLRQLDRQASQRRKALKDVAAMGFERPRKRQRPLSRTLSGLAFTGKVKLDLGRMDTDEVEDLLDDYIPGATVPDLLRLAGAPDGSDVTISETTLGLTIDTTYILSGRSLMSTRILRRDASGKTYLWNSKIHVNPTGEKLGLDVFRRQVDAAVALGLESIRCTAAQGMGYNGAYTWARFGYEFKIGRKSVQDLLLDDPANIDWERIGRTFQAVFDLSPGSRSRQVLDLYYGTVMTEKNRQERKQKATEDEQAGVLTERDMELAREQSARDAAIWEKEKAIFIREWEERHGRPFEGEFFEQPPITDDDAEQNAILDQVWDTLAARWKAEDVRK